MSIPRFQIWGDNDNTRAEDPHGEWCRWADVKDLLVLVADILPDCDNPHVGEVLDRVHAALADPK
jgi:hypothetical protein